MLPLYHDVHTLYTPPSSPPSPESQYLDSSSPPSSPSLDPRALDSDFDLDLDLDAERDVARASPDACDAPLDPLSGAYRGKRSFVGCSPIHSPKKRARFRSRSPRPAEDEDTLAARDGDWALNAFSSEVSEAPREPEPERQKRLWDEAVEKVFHGGEREIDLRDQGLTGIPQQAVRDLAKIVVLPEKNEPLDDIRAGLASPSAGPSTGRRGAWARTHTAPASTFSDWGRVGVSSKAVSNNSILGISREAINIFLGKNNISKLPMELWSLHNLTVLSLRNNSISYIPAEIAQLKELQTLNIANNKLQFIPSEMLNMKKLCTLNLFPNPFLPEPHIRNREDRLISITEVKGPRVPALTELGLRILLSRQSSSSYPAETKLQQYYELPLGASRDQRPVSAFRDIFNICVPGAVLPEEGPLKRLREQEEDTNMTGVGSCPNPRHHEPSTFIQPAEVRYTWESSTISIEKLGGPAAVQWRGCMQGCLDFLGPAPEDEKPETNVEVPGDDSMDADFEEGEVVQAVRFETDTELGFD